ncbi:enoyl-CoA hydratase/isomerase family protein [candidate division WOR-3 bacterium]|uniref:Enoyl-CoA hydratase/isomerase family protein n=1 Tax=candidate division WOR-3 bacterium TaxID=2052148 RepID=A0A660SG32_UNCW3|nr:MAG: enoyl-CoA hydratase/isomerase family protein [candidate division WOR-3 bacterium]
METIRIEEKDRIFWIIFDRPKIHNAFNDVMLRELAEALNMVKDSPNRVVVLTGEGKSFSAGADINWMRRVIKYSYEENLRESTFLADLFHKFYTLPKPTIAAVNGAAIGGGTGFVAVCDIAIASEQAIFSFSEVKIGLVPACISPYVVKKCGEGRARELFITGERIDARRAYEIGLVNRVVPHEELRSTVVEYARRIISSGPNAIAVCKRLLDRITDMDFAQARDFTAKTIAELRVSKEGQEGMSAFLNKKKPSWSD